MHRMRIVLLFLCLFVFSSQATAATTYKVIKVTGVSIDQAAGWPKKFADGDTLSISGAELEASTDDWSKINGLFKRHKGVLRIDGMKRVYEDSFAGWVNLLAVSLPKAEFVGKRAFEDCTQLSSVSLPMAEDIGARAFVGCVKLTSLTLPKATSIGKKAFSGCDNLESITLPEVVSVDFSTFSGCSKLVGVTLPKATSIGGFAFLNCSNLTFIILPEAVSIDGAAFVNCSKLTSATLPKVKTIGEVAFVGENFCTMKLPDTAPVLADASLSLVGPIAITTEGNATKGYTVINGWPEGSTVNGEVIPLVDWYFWLKIALSLGLVVVVIIGIYIVRRRRARSLNKEDTPQ